MKIMTTYKTKIRDSHRALANTVGIYRQAVDFLIGVALEEWNSLKEIERSLEKQRAIECAIHHTKSNPCPKLRISIPDLANSQLSSSCGYHRGCRQGVLLQKQLCELGRKSAR